jgi:hypothetical protein
MNVRLISELAKVLVKCIGGIKKNILLKREIKKLD